MSNYRKSYSLAKVKSRLRAEALKTEDEELAKLFWSLYYDARNAEYEMDALVQDTKILRLVEIMVQHGLLQFALDDLKALIDNRLSKADDETTDADTPESPYIKRDLPKQKRLFD
jgi:hypothetical protein